MAAFDSILNIDEWISDHYFTTDEGAVSYTHLTLPTIRHRCRSRWSPYH